jgi:DsbC/DsbD-like thiol-disulfide interchange protein
MTARASVVVAVAAGLLAAVPPASAQPGRPRAEVTPVVASAAKAGETARVTLEVRLPRDAHVQANKPRDPSLIPTVLTVETPPGITVEAVSYPPPTDLVQAGRSEPLAVLGPEFTIEVRLSIAATADAGEAVVPAVLRYQACNDALCFPPARATAEWRLKVER